MSNLICEMVPLITGGANITVGATILGSADKVWVIGIKYTSHDTHLDFYYFMISD
jgi:hypothetical protein